MNYNREDQFSLDRLINRTNAAEGSTLPPQQRGAYRVPYVSGLRVTSPEPTKYIVQWFEPTNNGLQIAQYNVFVANSSNINQPLGPFTVQKSPATITILAPTGSRLTFFVQTQLSAGLVNPPSGSAAVSIVAA